MTTPRRTRAATLAFLLALALPLAAPHAQAGFRIHTYRWTPTSVPACGDAATACIPLDGLTNLTLNVFAQDDALRPEDHDVPHELALLDATGALLSTPTATCPLSTLHVPPRAATLRIHVTTPTPTDLAAGCGTPIQGGIVVFW